MSVNDMRETIPTRVFQYSKYLVPVLFAAIVFMLYSNIFEAPFTFDDQPHIPLHSHIRLTDLTWKGIHDAAFQSPAAQRPLPNITLALNYYFHEYDVAGYHLVNIVIHIINGILLFIFVRWTLLLSSQHSAISYQSKTLNLKLGTSNSKSETSNFQLQTSNSIEWYAFAAALIWLVHPLCTQSVTYIIQRMNSMAVLFYMLSFLCYIKGRLSERTLAMVLLFTGSLLAGICALGSKQIAVTLPFFILLYEWYFLQDLDVRWLRKRVLPIAGILLFLAMAALFYLGENPLDKILAGYRSREFTLSQRVMTEFRVVVLYLSLLLYPNPSRLNLD